MNVLVLPVDHGNRRLEAEAIRQAGFERDFLNDVQRGDLVMMTRNFAHVGGTGADAGAGLVGVGVEVVQTHVAGAGGFHRMDVDGAAGGAAAGEKSGWRGEKRGEG